MADSRTSNVIKNSGANLINKASHILTQFALRTAFILLLGNEYTGISTLFTDILQVLSLTELGMGTAMVYALYRPLAEKDGRKISALMGFYKRVYTIVGCTVMGIGLLLMPFLDYLITDAPSIKENVRLIFFMYVITSASSYFLVYKTAILRANQQSRIISNIDSLLYVIEGVVEIIALLIFRAFFAYLILRFVFTLLRNIIISRVAERKFANYLSPSKEILSKEETRSLMKDAIALGIYKLSGVVVNSSSSIVISAFVGTQEVAIIGNFTLIINGVRTAIEQVATSAKASVGNLAVTASKEKQESVFAQMNFAAFWVASFCCTCFFVLLNPFVGDIWFSEAYKVSVIVVAILTANFFIAIMVYPVEVFRTGNGLFVQGKYRPAIMAGLNIILDLVFVRFWGIAGVLFASTVSRLLTQVWFDPYLIYKNVFKKEPFKFYAEYAMQMGVVALCCATAFVISELVYFDNNYLNFAYKMLVSVVVPNVIMLALFHRTKEFGSLIGTVAKALRKFAKR